MARQKWQEWSYNQDNLAIMTAWARAGLTDDEIARHIGISAPPWQTGRRNMRVSGKHYPRERNIQTDWWKTACSG